VFVCCLFKRRRVNKVESKSCGVEEKLGAVSKTAKTILFYYFPDYIAILKFVCFDC
jgi:hypothetical protein